MTKTLTALLCLAATLLAGCATSIDPNSAFSMRYAQDDAQVIERIRTERSPDKRPALMLNALLVGVWDGRTAVAKAALTAGVDPNQTVTFMDLYGVGGDFSAASAYGLGHALHRLPGRSSVHLPDVPAIRPSLLVRDSAMLDLLLSHGMRHEDQAELDEALYAALIVGKQPGLADRLREMGARTNLMPRPESLSLHEALALYAEPEMVEWALRNGLDPNERYSTPEGSRHPSRFGELDYHRYTIDFSMLHTLGQIGLPNYHAYGSPEWEREARRTASVARVLVAAGADVNARATMVVNIGPNPTPRYDWTPLHSAYRGVFGDNRTTNRAMVDFLLSTGADTSALDSMGDRPAQAAGVVLRVENEARRTLQAARQQQQQRQA